MSIFRVISDATRLREAGSVVGMAEASARAAEAEATGDHLAANYWLAVRDGVEALDDIIENGPIKVH